MMKHLKLWLAFLLTSTFSPLLSQQVIQLYEGRPPGSENWTWQEGVSTENAMNTRVIYNVSEPTITAYLPPYHLATGTAMVIAPGGAFHVLRMGIEGDELAKWLNSKGVAAFVLKYRLVRTHTDDPVKELRSKMADSARMHQDFSPVVPLAVNDALEAMQYVRSHAGEFDINPDKIGILGFSAGGTIAMSVAYSADPSSQPNFVGAIYPYEPAVIGEKVPDASTPIFLAVASDDELGMAPYSLKIYDKWHNAGQPAELHVYQKGGHGFSMLKQNIPTDTWYERFGEWLQLQGYGKKLYPNKYEKLYGEEAVARGKLERVKRMQEDYAQLARYKAANKALGLPGKDKERVVFLGNSITDAWPGRDSLFFAENNFIGRGISGQTSPQLLLRFQQDVVDLQPKAVVIHIGTNDVAENTGPYDPDFTMGNIRSMVEIARANDIKVILASVLPATKFEWNRALGDRSGMIVDLNSRLKAFATSNGIPYVDYHSALRNDKNGMDPELAADGVHPTPKGYSIMKSLVLPVVRQALNR